MYLESYNANTSAKATEVSGEMPSALAVDATNLYWGGLVAGAGAIRKKPLAGGTATTVTSTPAPAQGMVVDATHVYWTQGAAGGSVMKAPIAGASAPTVLASGQDTPWAIAVDGTYVYWTTTGTGGGTVNRVLK